MTAADGKKLDTILAKIELLQLTTKDERLAEKLLEAKNLLIRF